MKEKKRFWCLEILALRISLLFHARASIVTFLYSMKERVQNTNELATLYHLVHHGDLLKDQKFAIGLSVSVCLIRLIT